MARKKNRKSITIKENPSDIALKCLLQSFITVVLTLVIMRGMAYPLMIHEIFFGSLVMLGFLLCYTYSKTVRYVVYGTLIFIGMLLILMSISSRGSSIAHLANTVSTGTLPSVFILAGLNIFFYLFVVMFPTFLMCFLLISGIVIGFLFTEYGFPVTPFMILLSALYAVYMLERNTTVYLKASAQNRKMIATPPKMTFRMIVSYLLVYVLLNTLSIGNAPLLGDYSDSILNNIQIKLIGLFGSSGPETPVGEIFSISSMGFGNSSELGGDVVLNNKHVLTVYSDYVGLYLGGAAYEKYDGRRWTTEEPFNTIFVSGGKVGNNDASTEKDLGSITLQYDKLTPYRTITAVVKHEKAMITQSLFTFSKTTAVDFNNSVPASWKDKIKSIIFDRHEKFRFKEAVPSGGTYEVSAYNINYDSVYAENLIHDARRGLFDYLYVNAYRFYDLSSSGDIKQALYQLGVRADSIYDRYLYLPENLPARIYDLANRLTEGYEHAYDKAKAIENYLSNNYTYTLTPGDVPKDRDFVDYFLFDTKEGYCTYYATAMTILLRCVGVPTRYVEGFIVTGDNILGDGGFKVLGANAHAWPEVYFEGIGFVEFEPTSPYTNTDVEPVATPTPTAEPTPTPEPSETPEESLTPEPTEDPSATQGVTPSPTPDTGDNDEFRLSDTQLFIVLFILALIALVALIVFIMSMKLKLFRNKALKANYAGAVIYVYKRMEKVLGWYHVPREVTFTLPEYESVLYKHGVFDNPDMKLVYDNATKLFNKARYADMAVTADDAKAMLDIYEYFVRIEKARIGFMKYFIHRYIFGKI